MLCVILICSANSKRLSVESFDFWTASFYLSTKFYIYLFYNREESGVTPEFREFQVFCCFRSVSFVFADSSF